MQRFYMNGDFDHVRNSAQEVLEGKWADPIAGCLGGYLLLRAGKAQDIGIAVRNMVEYFGGLSDSHVLLAEYALRTRVFLCFLMG